MGSILPGQDGIVHVWVPVQGGKFFWFLPRPAGSEAPISLQATWFPFVLVAWDFFTAGVIPYPKIAGILTGHLYYFLDKVLPEQQGGRRYLNTPQFLRNIVPQPEVPRTAGFGSGGGVETFAPRTAEVADQGGARQRHSWGRGQRLGE